MSSDKAQFSLKQVTNLRKSLDFSRNVCRAKQKELAVPFVKHAREENISINISNFYSWKENNVKNLTYLTVFEIERTLGTALFQEL